MIDLHSESQLSLSTAAKLPQLLVNGRPPHISALFRWASYGAKNNEGVRIKLETFRTPRGRVTTAEAVDRFLAQLNGQPPSNPAIANEAASARQRAKAILAGDGL